MKTHKKKSGTSRFESFGLNENLVNGIRSMAYRKPTPVQVEAIPLLMKQRDVLALARTGSGKTAAFLLPMMHALHEHTQVVGVRGMVVSPTRELALQTCRFAKSLGKYTDLKYCLIVGGNSLEEQFCALTKNPDIIICTPGRFVQVMEESNLELKLVQMIIFDEGDRLFEQGFQPQATEILKRVPEKCTRGLFSATLPKTLADFALVGLRRPVFVQPDTEGTLPDGLSLSFLIVRKDQRLAVLLLIIREIIRPMCSSSNADCEQQGRGQSLKEDTNSTSQVAIFVPTRYHVEFYHMFLTLAGVTCSALHGNMDQEARRTSLDNFRNHSTNVLVVTDVAARGIDLPEMDYVINAYAPHSEKVFIHRVGRVARAGKKGTAFSLFEVTDMPFFCALIKSTGRELSCDSNDSDGTDVRPNSVYGSVPDAAVQKYIDLTTDLLSESPELVGLQRTSDNGMKQYRKLSKSPSKEVVDASKKLCENMRPHPLFARCVTSSASSMRSGITNYRPSGATYLTKEGKQHQRGVKETMDLRRFDNFVAKIAERQASKKRELQVQPEAGAGTLAERLMRQARAKGASDKHRQSQTWASSRSDSEYFLSYAPEARSCVGEEVRGLQDVANVTMELQAEAAGDLPTMRKRTVYSWDSRKKKYVKTSHEAAQLHMQGMKNEAGKKVCKIESRNIYGKWCAQNAIDLQKVGEQESEKHLSFRQAAYVSHTKNGKKLRGKLLEKHIQDQQNRSSQKAAQKCRFLKRS